MRREEADAANTVPIFMVTAEGTKLLRVTRLPSVGETICFAVDKPDKDAPGEFLTDETYWNVVGVVHIPRTEGTPFRYDVPAEVHAVKIDGKFDPWNGKSPFRTEG